MSDPLALLPLALAAGGGRIRVAATGTEHEVQQLVAAGLTLLQRSAPLVRALLGRRSGLLLPPSPAFISALAASDGRGAVLMDPRAPAEDVAFQCADAGVGAVFTIAPLAPRLPAGMTAVLLDDTPRLARVAAGGTTREIDLGTHHGLSLEGERDAPGRDEEAAIVYAHGFGQRPRATLTHAGLLAAARSAMAAMADRASDERAAPDTWSDADALIAAAAALLAGARLTVTG